MAGASISDSASQAKNVRIGFIGLGIMGRPMATNLLKAGYPLVVHSRSVGPVDELIAAGAERGTSPADVASRTNVVITMLPDTPDLELVVGGADGLLAAGGGSCTLVVDMSTVDPVATRRIAAEFAGRSIGFVDAPVSGGERGAIDGTLSIMVGGSASDVARVLPIFQALGRTIVHVGGVGAGQVAKAANQLVVAVTIEAVAEALALAKAAGVDAAKVREALLGGFASSRILEVHGQRMLDGDFSPGFRARLHLKDARIVARTAAAFETDVPALLIALSKLEQLDAQGRGELDHSALFLLAAKG